VYGSSANPRYPQVCRTGYVSATSSSTGHAYCGSVPGGNPSLDHQQNYAGENDYEDSPCFHSFGNLVAHSTDHDLWSKDADKYSKYGTTTVVNPAFAAGTGNCIGDVANGDLAGSCDRLYTKSSTTDINKRGYNDITVGEYTGSWTFDVETKTLTNTWTTVNSFAYDEGISAKYPIVAASVDVICKQQSIHDPTNPHWVSKSYDWTVNNPSSYTYVKLGQGADTEWTNDGTTSTLKLVVQLDSNAAGKSLCTQFDNYLIRRLGA